MADDDQRDDAQTTDDDAQTTDDTQQRDDRTQDRSTDTQTDDRDDAAAVLRAENQRLKREAAQREKERRAAEREAAKAEETRKAQQGEWQKLAEERAERISELEGQIAERDRRDAEREQRTTVEKVAERLNFRRPRRAFALLVDELGVEEASNTLADEQLTEAALRRLARAEPELVDNQRRSGAPVDGGGNGGKPDARQGLNRTIADLVSGRAPNA